MAAKKKKGPNYPSPERERMLPMWQQMDAILGGTETMRMQGTTYLPQHPGEEDARYTERLKTATLWNQTELTLNGWVGRPFRDKIKLNDDVPDEIKGLEFDIDRKGTEMNEFAQNWFKHGISKAFCHVLVDSTRFSSPDDSGRNPTIAEAREQNIRPYWVLIEPDEVIAARSAVYNGEEKLAHIRIFEETRESDPDPDSFEEYMVTRIRVFDRLYDPNTGKDFVLVTLWRLHEDKDPEEGESWYKEDQFTLGDWDEIPIVTFYADRQGFLLGKSPLQDLCDLNVRHWQEDSDQSTVLRISRFPMLAASGIGEIDEENSRVKNDMLVLGPHRLLFSEDPQAKYYYVEHTGKAIKSGQEALDKLEAKMSAYGSEFLKKSPDRQTATARTLDSAESVSPLQAVTLKFKASFESVLALTAKWLGVSNKDKKDFPGGTIEIVTDFGPEDATGIDMATLTSMYQSGAISRERYTKEMKRRGVLAEDYRYEDDEKKLQEEGESQLAVPKTTLPVGPKPPPQNPGSEKKESSDDRAEE